MNLKGRTALVTGASRGIGPRRSMAPVELVNKALLRALDRDKAEIARVA